MIRDIQTLFDGGAIGGWSDGQLLERFVADRNEAVFEVILRRHGPMVWGVCRRILHDHHDAEEAFQATFLVLARKAASVIPRERVGPWLHGVASRTAAKARTTRARRHAREARYPAPPAVVEPTRDDRLDQLDRELGRLPAKYRVPIVLCELEGKSHREAADELGWPIGTVSGRLSQARGILARRLRRPGLAHSWGPALALGTGRGMPAVAPAAHAIAAGAVPVGALVLAEGVVQLMMIAQIRSAAVILLGCLCASGAAGLAYRATAADNPAPARPAPAPRPAPSRPEVAPQAPSPSPSPSPSRPATDPPADPMTSYPFTINPDDVYELPAAQVDYGNFHLKAGGPVYVVPLHSDRGIAGAMLIGSGTFGYEPEPGTRVEGHQRAVLLRFNPGEQAAILPFDRGKKLSDQGIAEMTRQMLQVSIRHCYQSSKEGGRVQEILIPPRGAFAAVLYSQEHGDLLISFNDKTATAFNFTRREQLYPKK